MHWISEHPWETWFILAALLGVGELLSLDLVLIMFAGGAAAGGVAALIGLPAFAAVLVAAVVAVALLTILRPNVVHRLHAGPSLRTGADALVGTVARVLQPISHNQPGRVKIGGEEWLALPYDEDDRFEAGVAVEVVQIKGATAYVLPRPELGTPHLGGETPNRN